MHSDNTHALLERLGATTKKNEKLAILKDATACDLGVMRRALDPYITYGVAKVAVPGSSGPLTIGEDEIRMLDRLAKRDLSGNAAKAAIENAMMRLTPESQEVLRRILIKDLRCNTGTTLINTVHPGLIPGFDVQLSEVYDPARVKAWPVGFQRKLDGMRAVAIIDPDKDSVTMVSREGRPITTLDHIAEELKKHLNIFRTWVDKPIMLDGEATSGTFNDTMSQVKRKKGKALDAVFNVFDVFGPGGSALPQGRRLELVASLNVAFNSHMIGVVPLEYCHDHEEVMAKVGAIWAEGGEGGMVKDLTSPYELKRGFNWMKVKAKNSAEFVVKEIFEGTGKYEGTAGGFVVWLEDEVNTARVAGITEKLRDAIWAERLNMPGRIIEVEFHERTPDGSLRHPRFKRFRDTQTGQKE